MHGAFYHSERRQRDSCSAFGDSSGILQGVQNEAVARLRDSRDSFSIIMHDGKNSTKIDSELQYRKLSLLSIYP